MLKNFAMRPDIHKIAIVGRPNVGKSALFNRIIKQRKAIVEKDGPTTRDRISALVKWSGKTFELIDTPGLDFVGNRHACSLQNLIEKQIMFAIKEADQMIFVCDAMDGVSPLDHKICSMLRKSDKRITLVINKADNKDLMQKAHEFYALGFGEPLAVSALHGLGIGDLLDKVVDNILKANGRGQACLSPALRGKEPVKLAIIGKPNAGKSSFVNSVLEEERITVSDIPGTTRDSIDTYFEKDGKAFIIIDTAGLRSKRKIKDAITYFSVLRTEESIKKSDVVVIILDAPLGVTAEDRKIIDLVQKNSKPFILAVNKWDLAEKKGIDKDGYEKIMAQSVRFAYEAAIIFTSALKGTDILPVLDIAHELAEKAGRNFSTSDLNAILKGISFSHTRLYSIRQVKNSPPEFEIVAKNPDSVNDSSLRYITNIFRKKLGLEGVPIIIGFKKKVFK